MHFDGSKVKPFNLVLWLFESLLLYTCTSEEKICCLPLPCHLSYSEVVARAVYLGTLQRVWSHVRSRSKCNRL